VLGIHTSPSINTDRGVVFFVTNETHRVYLALKANNKNKEKFKCSLSHLLAVFSLAVILCLWNISREA